MAYKTIDLFCGAGGFSKGFEMTGKFEVVEGYDINEDALGTFNKNHNGKGIKYDIRDEVPDHLKKDNIDVVIGSPPCQGFSDAKGSRNVEDERNNLVFQFIRWVREIQPKVAIMENVSGLLTINDEFVSSIKEKYKESGYRAVNGILNSKEFGVPQKRERAIFIVTREDMPALSMPGSYIAKKQMNFFEKNKELFDSYTTVGNAISDLSSPTEDGVTNYEHEPKTNYQQIMRKNSNKIYNHIAKNPREKDDFIVKRIPEAKMYRSTRFGEKYIGVWDLFADKFNLKQRLIFWFIARYRGRKAYKLTDKSGPDYIPEEKIISSLQNRSVLNEAAKYGFKDLIEKDINVDKKDIRELENEGWLRKKKEDGIIAYDLNSKSGIRPRYMRLDRNDQSNTILTTDFNAREKLHPVKNRGLSLREGARIQSFPDDFIFEGDFKSIARQIGNAVPPLMARGIADHVLEFLDEVKTEEAI